MTTPLAKTTPYFRAKSRHSRRLDVDVLDLNLSNARRGRPVMHFVLYIIDSELHYHVILNSDSNHKTNFMQNQLHNLKFLPRYLLSIALNMAKGNLSRKISFVHA